MSAPPYMKLYVADYLGDTHHLSTLEHGAYLILLMSMWRAGGTLPSADANLAKIARLPADEWASIRDSIMPMFVRRGGRISHKRLTAELAKYERTSESRSEAGKKGASKKANQNNGGRGVFAGDPESNSRHNQNQNQNQKEKNVSNDTLSGWAGRIVLRKADVEAIWAAAPPKGRQRSSRKDLERALQGAARRGHAPAVVAAGVAAYYASDDATRDGGEYAKGVHRVVENDRWRDFAEASGPATNGGAWSEDRWRAALRVHRESGEWSDAIGPPPGQTGCKVPAPILREFGFQPETLL